MLRAATLTFGVELSDEQLDRMLRLVDLLREWNQRVSLTSIQEPEQIVQKHVLDSLAPAADRWRALPGGQPRTILDVGSGAGFPALPLAIAYPEIRVTALEASQKKCEFIGMAAAHLGLDIRVVKGRAEREGQLPVLRERFDLVIARAVAYLPVLAELCLPFARLGGYFLAMKSESLEEELTDGAYAVERLGGQLLEPVAYTVPRMNAMRWLVRVEKIGRTPKEYPREKGVPKKQPLVAPAKPRRRRHRGTS